jgi:hypothetical protein
MVNISILGVKSKFLATEPKKLLKEDWQASCPIICPFCIIRMFSIPEIVSLAE